MFWQVLRNSCYDKESLPSLCGDITYFEFWPSWSAKGDEISNITKVEPDVFIRFDNFDLIIEAKIGEFGGQYHAQWSNEINSYINEYGEGRSLYFIALGGCNFAKSEYITNRSKRAIRVYKSLWSSLLREVHLAKDSIERQSYHDGSRSQLLRILTDVVDGFAMHKIIQTLWLDSMNVMSVSSNTIKTLSDNAK
ncbi:MAG: hypothetical protein SNH73_00940 [Rikenellaceae bacterium]